MTDHDILQQYANFVYALALSRTNRASDAEAVFQEVFLTYARKQPTFADERRAKAWFVAATDTIAQPFAPDSAKNAAEESAGVGEEPAPPEKLTAQTERAMAALHAFCAEQSDQRTRGSTARFFLRAGAVTAALVLLVALTPLRSYATEAVRGWLNDIIPVNVSVVSADGCTIELVEARLANEFLYLTFDEDYSEYQNNYLTSFGDTDDSPDEDAKQMHAYRAVKRYKVYVPGLAESVSLMGRKWRCVVNVTPKVPQECGISAVPVMTLRAAAALELPDITPTLYDLDVSYTAGDLEFVFRKLYIDAEESNIAVELIPHGRLAGIDPRNLYPRIDITAVADEGAKNAWFVNREHWADASVFTHDSRYYYFLSDRYRDYAGMIDAAEHGGFEVELLRYGADIDGTYLTHTVALSPSLHRDEIDENDYDRTVSRVLSVQEAAVGERYDAKTDDDGTTYDCYRLSQTFRAGDFSFRAYRLDSDQLIYFDHMQLDGQTVDVGFTADEDNIVKLSRMVFAGEKDGTVIGRYTLANIRTRQTDQTQYGYLRGDEETGSGEIPDKLVLAYVQYSIYDDQNTHTITVYRCYNPDYYNQDGLSHAEVIEDKQTERESALFREHNTVTVVR